MQNNTLRLLGAIKKTEKKLTLKQSDIHGLVDLSEYKNLKIVNLQSNSIEQIIGLVSTVTDINFSYNKITNLNINLVTDLEKLNCSHNKLSCLDNLPSSLVILDCSYNHITKLSNLPEKIKKINCSQNKIILLDNLPNSLEELICSNNNITNLDWLPESLKILNCVKNPSVKTLDNLPNSLEKLLFDNNNIDLQILPRNLKELYCPSIQYEKFMKIPNITDKIKITRIFSVN